MASVIRFLASLVGMAWGGGLFVGRGWLSGVAQMGPMGSVHSSQFTVHRSRFMFGAPVNGWAVCGLPQTTANSEQ